ncbi:hypothetical protein BaRGS_00038988 [Batillaria attramentaria]|uniref:Uncharacterized protein n=1 Tax=Batillaria attramentaria TaxID=370345 RepID=A0ABD0J4H6_9CAEN
MAIVGCVALFPCPVFGSLMLCGVNEKNFSQATRFCLTIAAIVLLTEFAMFAGFRDDIFPTSAYNLSYCFALTVIAFGLCIAAFICFALFTDEDGPELTCEFKKPHIAVIIGLVCIGVALIFHIVGLATTGWASADLDILTVKVGLWSVCLQSTCSEYLSLPDWLGAVRAFSIIGMLMIVGCVVVGLLQLCKDNKMLPVVTAILAFVAAFCLLIEFAVFAGKKEEKFGDADLGYSFALTIVAFLLCIAAGGCFLVPKFFGQTVSPADSE